MAITLRVDDMGRLDEIVAHDAYVHLERMSPDSFSLIVHTVDRSMSIDLSSVRKQKIRASIYEDEVPE
jgi:hypothetical protein